MLSATQNIHFQVKLITNSECQLYWKKDHITESNLCIWRTYPKNITNNNSPDSGGPGRGKNCDTNSGDTVAVKENDRYFPRNF